MHTSDGLATSEPKSAAGRRAIPLGPKALEALRAHRVMQAMERERNGLPTAGENHLVFSSAIGTLLDASNLLAITYYRCSRVRACRG